MFERLQKPFLTVETGEAYQPIRITYDILQPDQLAEQFKKLKCVEGKQPEGTGWNVFWKDESDEIHFESLSSYKKNPDHPVRLATMIIKDKTLYLNLASFKRACLLTPFLHKHIDPAVLKIRKADFINKVFGLSERLPHGFTELFNEKELEEIVEQRISDYESVQERCEEAATAEEALAILSQYTQSEASKKLPFAERYAFQDIPLTEAEVSFLGFYIFLRGRELVAIRRWFGESGFTLADAAEETIEQVFGGMDIDILE